MDDSQVEQVVALVRASNGRGTDGEVELYKHLLKDFTFDQAKWAVVRLSESPPRAGIRPSDVVREARRLQTRNQKDIGTCAKCEGTGFVRTEDKLRPDMTKIPYERVTFCSCRGVPARKRA
jgi:hypothetical protein